MPQVPRPPDRPGYITDEIVVNEILGHLELPTEPMALWPARRLGQQELFDTVTEDDPEVPSAWESHPKESKDRNRGPPCNNRQDPCEPVASSNTDDWGA
jgi:hypothetical protein